MIYFDNAATTFPKPPSVRAAVDQALTRFGANPGRSGHKMAAETAARVYACREQAAKLFTCQPEQVIFTQNCTHSINIALQGLVRRGDHILISDLEHNAVSRTVHQLFLDGICTYSIVRTFEDDEDTVASFQRAIRPNTRILCCTHGSNVFGQILPIGLLGKLCRRHGLIFVVDAAQTGGVLDINMGRDCIDYLCLPGHKGLYGPAGTGLLIAAGGALLHPLTQGGTGTESLRLEMPDYLPERLESGTVNTPGILGLAAGMEYVEHHTTPKIYRFEMDLARRIYDDLREVPWVRFYSPAPEIGRTLPVLSLTLGSLDGAASAQWLDENGDIATRGGFHCAKLAHEKMGTEQIGTARVSIGSFNTASQADTFCRLIRRKRIP